MALRTDIAYEYDGSFEGFLCCVYEAFYRREAPAIFSEEGQALLYPTRRVQTDGRARKVLGSIREKDVYKRQLLRLPALGECTWNGAAGQEKGNK